MKPQPTIDERDQFDELLQAVGKSVEAKPDKGWEDEGKKENSEANKEKESEKHD